MTFIKCVFILISTPIIVPMITLPFLSSTVTFSFFSFIRNFTSFIIIDNILNLYIIENSLMHNPFNNNNRFHGVSTNKLKDSMIQKSIETEYIDELPTNEFTNREGIETANKKLVRNHSSINFKKPNEYSFSQDQFQQSIKLGILDTKIIKDNYTGNKFEMGDHKYVNYLDIRKKSQEQQWQQPIQEPVQIESIKTFCDFESFSQQQNSKCERKLNFNDRFDDKENNPNLKNTIIRSEKNIGNIAKSTVLLPKAVLNKQSMDFKISPLSSLLTNEQNESQIQKTNHYILYEYIFKAGKELVKTQINTEEFQKFMFDNNIKKSDIQIFFEDNKGSSKNINNQVDILNQLTNETEKVMEKINNTELNRLKNYLNSFKNQFKYISSVFLPCYEENTQKIINIDKLTDVFYQDIENLKQHKQIYMKQQQQLLKQINQMVKVRQNSIEDDINANFMSQVNQITHFLQGKCKLEQLNQFIYENIIL